MGILMKSEHLKRYRDVAGLLVKYGFYDAVRKIGLDEVLESREGVESRAVRQGQELANDLEEMGPTFVKLGQFLSTRPDILAPEYIAALERLQSKVGSFPYEQVKDIVESELTQKIVEAFAEFEPVPLAAASIGQVHQAAMHDGTQVAVKVQRPGIRDQMNADLEVLGQIAEFLQNYTELGELYGISDIFQEFRHSLLRELDYLQEKRNLVTMGANLKDFRKIVVPKVVDSHTTQRVLTMEFVKGRKITSILSDESNTFDGKVLLEETFLAYLQQILIDGFFHADPHPGNLVLTPDGRLGLLDLGMVARITPRMQGKLIRFILTVSEGDPRDGAEIAESMGEKTYNYDATKYHRRAVDLISRYQHATLSQLQIGTLMLEFTEVLRDTGIRVPRELAMLGKTLLHLDQIATVLDPDFDPNPTIQKYAAQIMIRHVSTSITPGNIMRRFLEIRDAAGRLPKALNSVLEQMARNELQVKVDAVDQTRLIGGLQKIANRITLGLLLASLIIGAGLLARIPTSLTILGYPAVAMLLFILAAAGAVTLMLDIVIYDEKPRKK